MKIQYILILLVFMSCNSHKKQETKIDILNLRESFIAKDETQFLNQFPKNFNQFHNYFGWNVVNDIPEELYKEANDYIDYWFDLLNIEKYKAYEKNIIEISTNGKWEPDGVNYFQDKAIKYIKEKRKYYLINDLKDSKAKSVLFFLFDSPHTKFDADFTSNLSAAKQHIVNELFETTFADEDEGLLQTDDISFYNLKSAKLYRYLRRNHCVQ